MAEGPRGALRCLAAPACGAGLITTLVTRSKGIATSNKGHCYILLLGARTQLVAPGLTARNKKLLGVRASLHETVATSSGRCKTCGHLPPSN